MRKMSERFAELSPTDQLKFKFMVESVDGATYEELQEVTYSYMMTCIDHQILIEELLTTMQALTDALGKTKTE